MKNKILIVNTDKLDPVWLDYLEELCFLDFDISLKSSEQSLENFCKTKNLELSNYKALIPTNKNNLLSLIFLCLRPVFFPLALACMTYYKFKKKINTIVCFSSFEKMHISRAAHLLKIKVVWIMSPNEEKSLPKLSIGALKGLSKKAKVVCLTKKCQETLKDKLGFKNVQHLNIGIKENLEQKNIFDSLAKNTTGVKKKNFFTIGTIGNLDRDIVSLEKLLHATKNCLSMIPHLQLIIAGEGEGRKKLTWMAKKMEINNLVWFVGNHRNPHKWLSNFDLFVSTNTNPSLSDLNMILLAKSNALAVVAPSDIGLEEFVGEKSGLVYDPNKNSELSDAIIQLEQDQDKRKRFGQNAQENVKENFKLSKTVKSLAEILRQ